MIRERLDYLFWRVLTLTPVSYQRTTVRGHCACRPAGHEARLPPCRQHRVRILGAVSPFSNWNPGFSEHLRYEGALVCELGSSL